MGRGGGQSGVQRDKGEVVAPSHTESGSQKSVYRRRCSVRLHTYSHWTNTAFFPWLSWWGYISEMGTCMGLGVSFWHAQRTVHNCIAPGWICGRLWADCEVGGPVDSCQHAGEHFGFISMGTNAQSLWFHGSWFHRTCWLPRASHCPFGNHLGFLDSEGSVCFMSVLGGEFPVPPSHPPILSIPKTFRTITCAATDLFSFFGCQDWLWDTGP